MKNLLRRIFRPYVEIKELKEEIRNQDRQFSVLQRNLNIEKCKNKKLKEELIKSKIDKK